MAALTKEALVHWRVVVERADDPTGSMQRRVIADVERSGMPRESEVGMSHDESKLVLHALQSVIVTDQAREFAQAARQCVGCRRPRVLKEHRYRHLDTLFGRVVVPAPRFERCRCGHASRASPVSALLPHRTTPGLRHLQARLGALMPYRRAADVLDTFLPPLSSFHYSTTRNRLLHIGQAIEDELQDGIEHERTTTDPAGSMVVGIDGAFVKAVPTETRRKDLEVVVGRIEVPSRPHELFAVVREPGGQSRERLRATLRRAGRGPATRLVVLSDGEDEMRELPGRWLGAEQRHRLDWRRFAIAAGPSSALSSLICAASMLGWVAGVQPLTAHRQNHQTDAALRQISLDGQQFGPGHRVRRWSGKRRLLVTARHGPNRLPGHVPRPARPRPKSASCFRHA
jgi:hypothetical protein